MLKSEMTKLQLETRAKFVAKLISKNWNVRGWEMLFEQQVQVLPEAQAEYDNSSLSLRVSYFVQENYMLLELFDTTTLIFRFYPKEHVLILVDKVTEWQDDISLTNYPDFIRNIVPFCEIVALETPDGLVQISAED